MQTKDLILHLIREELRNKRLIFSLEETGFDCSDYMLSISRVILELVGFTEITDELDDWFYGLIVKALEEITYHNLEEMLQKWPLELYIELLAGKKPGRNEIMCNEQLE